MKLFRFSLLIVILILLVSNLHSIDEKGVKLGLNFSTLSGENMNNAEVRANPTAGIYFNQRLNNWLALQPELLYSSRGSFYRGAEKIDVDDDMDGSFNEDPFDLLDNDGDGLVDEDKEWYDFDVTGHYQLSYLEIPVLLKASTAGFFSQNLNILFGPSFNFLLEGKYKLKQEGYSYHEGDLSGLDSFDVSGVLGLEYSTGRYRIELRANHSFSENSFISAGEVIIRSMDGSDDYFGPTYDESSPYYRFEENSGFNTSVSLILGYTF